MSIFAIRQICGFFHPKKAYDFAIVVKALSEMMGFFYRYYLCLSLEQHHVSD
jgi:hypothetical protein